MRNNGKNHVDPEALQSVKQNIARIRKKKGLTQTELGQKIGVSQRVITYYENEAMNISWDAMTALAKALEVPVKKLLDIKTPNSSEEPPLPKTLQKRIHSLKFFSPKSQKMVQDYIDTVAKAEKAK